LTPNGSRLSSGALQKRFIPYPTRAVSFKRLLGRHFLDERQ